uniref:BZIP domain-containing protein n=1 Tax=Hyaloperonospora arabidopsidis (strain Emoy2) TaxID=559515 RepID=M4BLL4_HYAAE
MNVRGEPFGPKQTRRALPVDLTPPLALKLMSNSERGKYYRRRRNRYSKHLESRVAELRNEIAALTVSRQVQQELALSQRRTPLGAAALIVNEYCLLFTHGTPVLLAVNESDASASLVAQATSTQRGFLQAVVIDRLRFGDFVGLDLVLAQWERYSLYHSAIDWTMESLDVIQPVVSRELTTTADGDADGPLVVTITATLRVQFSQRTIEKVFPHLMGDQAIMRLLLGLVVKYPCINHFHFDRNGAIEWYAPEVNYVAGLMNALKCPELVARIMGNALIEQEHMIGDDSDGRRFAALAMEDKAFSAVSEVAASSSLPGTMQRSQGKAQQSAGGVREKGPIEEPAFLNRSPRNRLELSYILATE